MHSAFQNRPGQLEVVVKTLLPNCMSKVVASLCVLLVWAVCQSSAQDTRNYGSVPRVTMAQSRAEIEAEQRVSLSADKIVELLQREPGLLLQIKKQLVRKAFEQGRLLDPAELTDDAVFRLLREDENVRILATHEIEDRSYIRPKP